MVEAYKLAAAVSFNSDRDARRRAPNEREDCKTARSGASVAPIRLGINIDHVATLRNARGGRYPDPLRAAKLAVEAGADNITAHLREDRRHIRDEDIARLTSAKLAPLNLEMAVTPEMLAIALDVRPHASCLVPERRQEITTEGGLDVASQIATIDPVHRRAQARRHPGLAVHRPRA